MLPTLFVVVTSIADFLIIAAAIYYFTRLHQKEIRLEKKEHAIDDNYHHVVDDALSKERQILTDATSEATQILSNAQSLDESSRHAIDQAIKAIVADLQKEGATISQAFSAEYSASHEKTYFRFTH